MENTACDECPFVKQGFCSVVKECPNYTENFWEDGKTQEIKLVKDCAPKRMLKQQLGLQNRMEGIQAALEQSRNEYAKLSGYLCDLIEMSKTVVLENSKNQLEKKNEIEIPFISDDANVE